MASKNFCNQKVKNKKKMLDSIISISFNTASQKVHQHRFHEVFHLKRYLWQRIYSVLE